MDSNFQYASTERWHRATDLLLPPTVKRRSAGRPPPIARPRSEAQRGSARHAAMRSTQLARVGARPGVSRGIGFVGRSGHLLFRFGRRDGDGAGRALAKLARLLERFGADEDRLASAYKLRV